jgi:hypothetical protein
VNAGAVAVSPIAVVASMLWTCVAHRARADVRAGVVEGPVALSRCPPPWRFGRRSFREIAEGVMGCVLRFGGEIAAGELDPEWCMGIGAGQGRASGDKGPCPLPPDEDGQGPRCLDRVPGPVMSGVHAPTVSAAWAVASEVNRLRDLGRLMS